MIPRLSHSAKGPELVTCGDDLSTHCNYLMIACPLLAIERQLEGGCETADGVRWIAKWSRLA